MSSIVDYNHCKLCNKHIYKNFFNTHIKDCLAKHSKQYKTTLSQQTIKVTPINSNYKELNKDENNKDNTKEKIKSQ